MTLQTSDEAIAAMPLFAAASRATECRKFHERDEAQAAVLAMLRSNTAIQKKTYETTAKNGSRLAPVIEQLRNAHGFLIGGTGTVKDPYTMRDIAQRPSLARVTPDMKELYYKLPHWYRVKHDREERDFGRCVLCHSTQDLRCHHVSYANIFAEPLKDLVTLCDECHCRVHQDCRLKFPSGVSVQYAHLLGWKGFEKWLMP
jgi:hypothetical protein